MVTPMQKIVKDWLERAEEKEILKSQQLNLPKNKNLDRYTHKSNNGSDFGSINIYYNRIEPIALNYQKVNYIDPTEDSVITGDHKGKIKNFRIIPELPPYLELDTETGEINFRSSGLEGLVRERLGSGSLPVYTIKAEGIDSYTSQRIKIVMLSVFTTEEEIHFPGMEMKIAGLARFTSKPKLPDGVVISPDGSISYPAFDTREVADIVEWFKPTTYSISAWVRRDGPIKVGQPATDREQQPAPSEGAIAPYANWKVNILVKPVIPVKLSYPALQGNNFPIGSKVDHRIGKVALENNQGFINSMESFKEKRGLRFTIDPKLPEGFKIGEHTGLIWGKAKKETQMTEYTITATNSYSSISTTVSFSVGQQVSDDTQADPPPTE
jgi:hypothetical protein